MLPPLPISLPQARRDHGRRAARVILGLADDGFIAAPAQVIARESA